MISAESIPIFSRARQAAERRLFHRLQRVPSSGAQRFLDKYSELQAMILCFDPVFRFPHLAKLQLKKIYFILTKGRRRVRARRAVRPVELCDSKSYLPKLIHNNLYYIAQKIKTPSRTSPFLRPRSRSRNRLWRRVIELQIPAPGILFRI
jgi:hypothetical protein